jgi:hypothetical protein
VNIFQFFEFSICIFYLLEEEKIGKFFPVNFPA